MKKLMPFTLIVVALFLSFLLNACKKETDPGNDISYVSIHNATINGLDFYIGQRKVNEATLQRGSSTIYIGVYDGTWRTEAILADSASSNLEREMKLNGNENTSLYVIKPDSLDFFLINDDLNERNADRPKIKFLNLSTNAGLLTLELSSLIANNNFPATAYKTFTPYQEIDERSSYRIVLKSAANATLIETERNFERGKLYTIWTTGIINTTVAAQELRLHITEVQ